MRYLESFMNQLWWKEDIIERERERERMGATGSLKTFHVLNLKNKQRVMGREKEVICQYIIV